MEIKEKNNYELFNKKAISGLSIIIGSMQAGKLPLNTAITDRCTIK